MPFVKLDCGILNSTLWLEREMRELFITALLMAEPVELKEETAQIKVHSLEETGWKIPPGWYGFVPAAGCGICRRAHVDRELGMKALEQMGNPEPESRSQDFEGRRMVRIDGGYIVLNYMKYRERDYTGAERARRYRIKKAAEKASRCDIMESRCDATPEPRDITQAEEEVRVQSTPTGGAGGGKKDNLPTSEEAVAISSLFNRKLTTPWSKKERAAFTDGRMRGVITIENIGLIMNYYQAERSKGDNGPNRGIHRRDLQTFLNNFDGELDRASAFAAERTGGSGIPGTAGNPFL